MIDLRSDTVALPTPAMRRAMAAAELGDDVYHEDPSVNRLEERAAALLGKQAALLVTTGTMGNLLGVLTGAPRGSAALAEAGSHVYLYEVAGAAALGGVQLQPVETARGMISAAQVRAAHRDGADEHSPVTTLLCLENTHNRHGGTVATEAQIEQAATAAHELGMKVHLDGARLFNAAVALGVPAATLAAPADTVTFCLSKGLGCPAGSVFCGDRETIAAARRWRKMLGGGMRQAGVLAAPGLLALDSMIERLAEDHRHARTLAEGLAELPGLTLELDRVETNIVRFQLADPASATFEEECRRRGLLAGAGRMVTHVGIGSEEIQRALSICSEVLTG